jgi:hypothetical protein
MNVQGFGSALGISAAAALLAACGGSQAPIGAPGAMPPTSAVARHSEQGGSWMLPEAKNKDLLYVSTGGDVYVFTFPGGTQVGMLTGLEGPSGLCSDSAGDVWVVNQTTGAQLVEYAHGSTQQKATLGDLYQPNDCSVDPSSGNLAVSNNSGGEFNYGSIFIYANASGLGTLYSAAAPEAITYDDAGNVFVILAAGTYMTKVAWLPKGGSSVENLPGAPGRYSDGILWDGRYLAISVFPVNVSVRRFEVQNGRATKVGKNIHLNAWFDRPATFWIQGSTFVGMAGGDAIGFWNYPAGGNTIKTIGIPSEAYGVTVSLAKHK